MVVTKGSVFLRVMIPALLVALAPLSAHAKSIVLTQHNILEFHALDTEPRLVCRTSGELTAIGRIKGGTVKIGLRWRPLNIAREVRRTKARRRETRLKLVGLPAGSAVRTKLRAKIAALGNLITLFRGAKALCRADEDVTPTPTLTIPPDSATPTPAPSPTPTLPAIPPGQAIFVDHQLVSDCSAGDYSIALRDCSGFDGTAYISPQAAIDAAQPATTIYFRAGRYNSAASTAQRVPIVDVQKSGLPLAPITIRNFPGEEVVLDAALGGGSSRYWAMNLGKAADIDYITSPSPHLIVNDPGVAVHDIVIIGLTFEHASYSGLKIHGGSGTSEVVTRNITVQDCIARYNSGAGFSTQYAVENILFERLEAYENESTGIVFGRLEPRQIHALEPDAQRSTARYSVMRRCLSYNNNKPVLPGNTDGFSLGSSYRSSIVDSIAFANGDDGYDIYSALECTVANSVAFNHLAGLVPETLEQCLLARQEIAAQVGDPSGLRSCWNTASMLTVARDRYNMYVQCVNSFVSGGTSTADSCFGNGSGIKFSAGGGGKHTIIGSIVANNKSWGFEGSKPSNRVTPYYPSVLFHNLAYYNSVGFSFGSNFDADPIWNLLVARNNLAFDNLGGDSRGYPLDCSGQDCSGATIDHNLSAASAKSAFMNPDFLSAPGIDVDFSAAWTTEQKLSHIRAQISAALAFENEAAIADDGAWDSAIHCPSAGTPSSPSSCRIWLGSAPAIGPFE